MSTPGPSSSRINARRSPRNLWKNRRPSDNMPALNTASAPFNVENFIPSVDEQEMAILKVNGEAIENRPWRHNSDNTDNSGHAEGTVTVTAEGRVLSLNIPSSPHGEGPRWTPSVEESESNTNSSDDSNDDGNSDTGSDYTSSNSAYTSTECESSGESDVEIDDIEYINAVSEKTDSNQVSMMDIAMGVMLLNHLFTLVPQTSILTVERFAGAALLACTVNLGVQIAGSSSSTKYKNGKWHFGALAIMTLCKLRNSFH